MLRLHGQAEILLSYRLEGHLKYHVGFGAASLQISLWADKKWKTRKGRILVEDRQDRHAAEKWLIGVATAAGPVVFLIWPT
jgi:hypothetical protein